MDDAEAIKKKKLEELQRRQAEATQQHQAADDAQARHAEELQKEAIMRTLLTPEARERLVRVKMARADFGAQVETIIMQLAQQGRITQKLSEEMLLSLLRQVKGEKRDFNIIRK